MTGLIWVIQVVQYPSFIHIPSEAFEKYHNFHTIYISLIVGFPMFLELFSSVWIYWESRSKSDMFSLFLVISVWLVTFFMIVPIHDQLAKGFDEDLIQKLVSYNWIRTILWSTRSALLLIQLKV
jgi:hypothetical protein